MLNRLPRMYRGPFAFSLALHLTLFVALILLNLRSASTALMPPEPQTVAISLVEPKAVEEPAPPPAIQKPSQPRGEHPKPEPTPKPKPDPTPKPKSPAKPTPEPKQATPKPTPKPESNPRPTPKPEPTAKPTPRPTPRPTATPKPTPVVMDPSRMRELREQAGIRQNLAPERVPERPAESARKPESAVASSPAAVEKKPVTGEKTAFKSQELPDYYARQALGKVARFFRVPTAQQRDVTAVLSVRIARNGSLSKVRVLRGSGDGGLDALAVKALETAASFAPLPADVKKDHVDVEVTFYFTP